MVCLRDICLSRPYRLKFFKGYLPQNLLSPRLNNLSHIQFCILETPEIVYICRSLPHICNISSYLIIRLQELVHCEGVFMVLYSTWCRTPWCTTQWWHLRSSNPDAYYMFKVNNRNTRTRCEICSELTIKTPKRRQWRRSCAFIVNFKHILHLALLFLLLTLSR